MSEATTENGGSSDLKAQIQRYLVASGNYEKISDKLGERLLQDGWVDEVRRLITAEIRATNSTNFSQILSKIEPEALDLVSTPTKEEVLEQIRVFLNEIVGTE
ncbi:hypothetical protein HG535_0A02180 [Zygotorulaspora mrakii]|uniref:Transcription and mRNA export factor SUS1 n=1 Tax=Zygotorulaspora mrakii TaxID=42260 RepID=A0A7H9AVB0_ZYGMR|nr:uncharacterized protein HG535_0A02180 [Zygotorulaspora mrakii]QLG70280.1 hypothetical protein HG535_0A02180 [Zygotorulaspora mrakii]